MYHDFLLPLYIGMVPVISVIAGVLAIRWRHRIGVRASNLVIAGSVLLLLAHLYPLWGLRSIAEIFGLRSQDGFSKVEILYVIGSVVQLAMQATGLGLILAAVFQRRAETPRPTPDVPAVIELSE